MKKVTIDFKKIPHEFWTRLAFSLCIWIDFRAMLMSVPSFPKPSAFFCSYSHLFERRMYIVITIKRHCDWLTLLEFNLQWFLEQGYPCTNNQQSVCKTLAVLVHYWTSAKSIFGFDFIAIIYDMKWINLSLIYNWTQSVIFACLTS